MKVWFNKIIKPKFFELDWEKKRDWRKKNPVTEATVCIICNFPLDNKARNGWFDNVAKSEDLLLRNIYSSLEMKSMNIFEIDEYKEILYRIINIFHDFELALQDGVLKDEVRNFMMEDLSDDYETFQDIRADRKNFYPKKTFLK